MKEAGNTVIYCAESYNSQGRRTRERLTQLYRQIDKVQHQFQINPLLCKVLTRCLVGRSSAVWENDFLMLSAFFWHSIIAIH